MTFSRLFVIYMLSAFVVLLIIHVILRKPHPFFHSLKAFTAGIISVILISMAEPYTGIKIPLNEFSLAVSSVAGLPGIGALALLNSIVM